jgi:hypothetical protein
MSKFITNSANYSETNLVKTKFLKPILEQYNLAILNFCKNSFTNSVDTEMFIPNNNKKYYMFVMNKKDISDSKSNYKVLYFFPEVFSNLQSDFFIEMDFINNFPKKTYLFEGYLYDKSNFLITDILAIDNTILNTDYHLRLDLIQGIIPSEGIKNINCHMNINIHPVFNYSELNYKLLLDVFKNNFVYKKEIDTVEYIKVKSLNKRRETEKVEDIYKPKNMILTKTKYSDVYKVNDYETGNDEGILYVKSIKISKQLSELKDSVLLCKYNSKFFKWEPANLI